LKEKALDRTMWRAGFGRGFGRVVRQTTWMNEYLDVVTNSSSSWSLNFVSLFIMLYCVDVHIW
jgi:hypothetical protein